MQRFELIDVVGIVKKPLSAALFLVSLANGHDVIGHLEESLAGKVLSGEIDCLPGTRVLVQLRAFDLSSGRILSVQPSDI